MGRHPELILAWSYLGVLGSRVVLQMFGVHGVVAVLRHEGACMVVALSVWCDGLLC